MKNLKYLLVLLVGLFILPFSVFAEGEEVTSTAENTNEVTVYLFRGEGCPHCQEAEEWFDEIEGEFGQYFKVVDYETWYDTDNAELMKKVAEARGETAEGVPYIIIGNKSWNGFADDYKEEILSEIKSEYNKDASERYDIMKHIDSSSKSEKKSSGSDVLALILIIVVFVGICFGIYKARMNTK